MLDREVVHRLPRASTVRSDFYIHAMNTVYEHKGDIIQCFETIRGVWAYHSAGSWRVCEATGWYFFQLLPETISLHHASCGHSLQPAPEADHRLSLCSGNHTAVHSFSDLSLHYSILAVAGHRIIKEQLPQREVLRGQPRWQHALTSVDCEGPFITACTFNY